VILCWDGRHSVNPSDEPNHVAERGVDLREWQRQQRRKLPSRADSRNADTRARDTLAPERHLAPRIEPSQPSQKKGVLSTLLGKSDANNDAVARGKPNDPSQDATTVDTEAWRNTAGYTPWVASTPARAGFVANDVSEFIRHNVSCPRGYSCAFAYCPGGLPLYKKIPCRNFRSLGGCSMGVYCAFRHGACECEFEGYHGFSSASTDVSSTTSSARNTSSRSLGKKSKFGCVEIDFEEFKFTINPDDVLETSSKQGRQDIPAWDVTSLASK